MATSAIESSGSWIFRVDSRTETLEKGYRGGCSETSHGCPLDRLLRRSARPGDCLEKERAQKRQRPRVPNQPERGTIDRENQRQGTDMQGSLQMPERGGPEMASASASRAAYENGGTDCRRCVVRVACRRPRGLEKKTAGISSGRKIRLRGSAVCGGDVTLRQARCTVSPT